VVHDARELLTANLSLVERAIAFACRRHHLQAEDAEELSSIVKLKLVKDDYAIVRAYEGRSSFATYISTVVQRLVLDYRIQMWGKWHASAEAKRAGPLAVDLERLLYRDGRTLNEAPGLLRTAHGDVTRAELESIAAKLPERAPRRRDVPLEDAEPYAVAGPDAVEEHVLTGERRDTARQVEKLLAAAFEKMPDDDRLVLQLRFEQGMTVAQIARALGRDQKFLYRQIERRMREIAAEVQASGVAPRAVLDLIGRDETDFAFDFGKHGPRPSIQRDEQEMAQPEETE
jgi:RNA polymerase sigma factor for flagellar operon FliA